MMGSLLVILIVGIILVFLMKQEPSDKESNDLNNISKEYILEVDVLRSDFFEELRRYAEFPIEPRFPGRKNPFEPY